jgi:hypothetical protein
MLILWYKQTFSYIHTYIPLTLDPRRGSRGVSDIPPRRPLFTKMRNTADVTDGKPLTVWLQSISCEDAVNPLVAHHRLIAVYLMWETAAVAVNPLVAFYDFHGRKREVLFCSVPDTTRDRFNLCIHIGRRSNPWSLAQKASIRTTAPNCRLSPYTHDLVVSSTFKLESKYIRDLCAPVNSINILNLCRVWQTISNIPQWCFVPRIILEVFWIVLIQYGGSRGVRDRTKE